MDRTNLKSIVIDWVKKHDFQDMLPLLNDDFMDRLWESSKEKMTHDEILSLVSFVAGSMASQDPRWDFFAADVLMGMHKDNTPNTFLEVLKILQNNEGVTGKKRPLLDEEFVSWILQQESSETPWIEQMFQEETTNHRIFPMTLFGWKTLYKSYLFRSNGKVIERPDHLWFRVALFLHRDNQTSVLQCFQDLRRGRYTHATPTLFYAGARRPQMASCFPWNAIVYTPHGGRPISSIQTGDLVLTHKGRWKKVEMVHKDVVGKERTMVRLYSGEGEVVDVTSDHEFMTKNLEWVAIGSKQVEVSQLFHASQFFSSSSYHNGSDDGSDDGSNQRWKDLVLFQSGNTDTNDRNVPFTIEDSMEYKLSRDHPETIPFLLRQGLESTEMMDMIECRKRWQQFRCPYLNMWYEQWMVLVGPKKDDEKKNKKGYVDGRMTSSELEKVYTLTVEEDHSYVVQGFVAKNCFLVGTEDSIEGIFKTISDVAQISKWAGGLGVHISNIRADRSYIYGTNGYSNGILPMIRLFNDTSRYIDQCFGGNTWIWTRTRGWTPIRSFRGGEEVLTASGEYARVKRVLSHVVQRKGTATTKRKYFSVSSGYVEKRKVVVTDGHDFLVRDKYENDYKAIGELSREDSVQIRYPPYSSNASGGKTHWTTWWAHMLGLGVGLGKRCQIQPEEWKIEVHPETREMVLEMYQIVKDQSWAVVKLEGLKYVKIKWNIALFPWCFLKDVKGSYSIVPPYEWMETMDDCETTQECVKVFLEVVKKYKYGGWIDDNDDIDHNQNETKESWKRFMASLEFLRHPDRVRDRDVLSKETWKSKCRDVRWGGVVEENEGDQETLLYDLEVEGEDKSYTTEIGTVHNGGGKRNGAFAMYMEPWHADIVAFLHAKKNTGPEEERARDLFYGLWIPDLFMRRVQKNGIWSLMCPMECPGLTDAHGEAFDRLYEGYEAKGMYRKQMAARELFTEMVKSQIETGTPYFLYKDACNRKSNQKHLGTIKSSNLCVSGETMLLTRNGYVPMEKCVGETVEAWNGETFERVVPLETKADVDPQDWLYITTTSGKRLECTLDHLFLIGGEKEKRVKAVDLKPGMEIRKWKVPSFHKFSSNGREEILRVFSYVYRHGVYMNEPTKGYYFLCSGDEESLRQLQMTLEIGNVTSRIENISTVGDLKQRWRLEIPRDAWVKLATVSSSLSSLSSSTTDSSLDSFEETEKIDRVEKIPGRIKTKPSYCLREPMKHTAVFQGMLTGQCTEIIEYSDASQYAVCNLASISLPSCLDYPKGARVPDKVYVRGLMDMDMVDVQWLVGRIKGKRIEVVERNDVPRGMVRFVGSSESGTKEEERTAIQFFNEFVCPVMDLKELYRITKELTYNLNEVINKNRYPTSETRVSNLMHRPIGIGVQGLADVFCALKISFDSLQARQLNQQIFETIYHAALAASCDCAQRNGGPYESYEGSPLSEGKFHWELCAPEKPYFPMIHDWESLRKRIQEHGILNSLMIAPMPTASTSQILGNNECFEPYTSNFYTRRTSAGEFLIYNRELHRDLCALGMWTPEVRNKLLWNRGSVRGIEGIPEWMREVYKTVWELPQKSIIDQAVDRHFFVDQSQSMNLFLAEPNLDTLMKMHFYGFSKGLKTGSYYIRTRPPLSTTHFALEASAVSTTTSSGAVAAACPYRRKKKDSPKQEEEECLSCSA